jgi:hypothetical protein
VTFHDSHVSDALANVIRELNILFVSCDAKDGRGRRSTVAVTAVARELAGFI